MMVPLNLSQEERSGVGTGSIGVPGVKGPSWSHDVSLRPPATGTSGGSGGPGPRPTGDESLVTGQRGGSEFLREEGEQKDSDGGRFYGPEMNEKDTESKVMIPYSINVVYGVI